MLNWGIVNKIGVSVHCANEKEANIFLKECEKKNIPWWNGSKATEASPDNRLFSTNGGNFFDSI